VASPLHNGSSSSSSNRGGLIVEGGYFSSSDANFGSGENGHMSSFSDINNIKSIKSSVPGVNLNAQYGCGSTMPSVMS